MQICVGEYFSRHYLPVSALVLVALSWLSFADLRHHLLDIHDAEMFGDHLEIRQDGAFFFSPHKAQASGRPLAAGRFAAAQAAYARALAAGRAEAERIGALEDLLELRAHGPHALEAQRILDAHWPGLRRRPGAPERIDDAF